MTFGELRVGVDFNPSGNTLVDTIKRKAADLIDHINGLETADFNEPGEVARLKALAMTDIESAAHWAVKASARSGAAQRRLVTTLRQFCDLVGWLRLRRWLQAIERVAEVERAARATAPAGERRAVDKVAKSLIDGGARPQGTARRRNRQPRLWVGRDAELAQGAPMARRLAAPTPRVDALHATPAAHLDRRPPRGRAPRARFLARLESPDPARRSAAPRTPPPALDPLTAPRSPGRIRPLRTRHAQHPRIPAPSIARRPHPEMPAWTLTTAPRHRSGVESALKAALAALTGTTARCALAMHPARSVRRNIAASTATSCVSALP